MIEHDDGTWKTAGTHFKFGVTAHGTGIQRGYLCNFLFDTHNSSSNIIFHPIAGCISVG